MNDYYSTLCFDPYLVEWYKLLEWPYFDLTNEWTKCTAETRTQKSATTQFPIYIAYIKRKYILIQYNFYILLMNIPSSRIICMNQTINFHWSPGNAH